jgi:choline-glycine betaine transporter
VDIITNLSSLIVNSEITPFMAITLFIVYNLKCQSEQNKKDIKQLEEQLKEDAKKKQEEEINKLREELKIQKEQILERAKQHNENNSNAVSQYIKELLKRLDNDKSK